MKEYQRTITGTSSFMNNKHLSDIFEGKFNGGPFEEVLHLASDISPSLDLDQLREVHRDLTDFFTGRYPGFQKSTLPYHNLRHTQMVVLAAVRLFHGLHSNHIHISTDILQKGILSAYFHDTGLLHLEDDPPHFATEFMADHEARSTLFLLQYTAQKGFPEDIARDCGTIIKYTALNSDPATFEYHPHEIQLAGQVVGSADILAQMADRYYLECLPLLFDEQQAGGINQHQSSLELIEHTTSFYHNVALKRLITTFSNTSRAMRTHFRVRFGIDRNLYMENIDKNIAYVKEIIARCDNIECLEKYLKRLPPTI
ncbi:MAG: hypothetical protein ACWGOX_06270 [Desulforhopalus sp.]